MTCESIEHYLSDVHEPTPVEIERPMRYAQRLRAQAFRNVTRAAATMIARAFCTRTFVPVSAESATTHVHAA